MSRVFFDFSYRLIEADGGPRSSGYHRSRNNSSAFAEMLLRPTTRIIDRSFANRSGPGLLKRRRGRVRQSAIPRPLLEFARC